MLVVHCVAARAGHIDVEFSDYTIGQTFPNASLPQTIVTDGVAVDLTKYNGSFGANGRIVDAPLFGGSNNALFLAADLRAEIVLPFASTGGFFYFRNQGGTNLLEINGATMDFTDPALAGSVFGTVGGVSVHSSPLTGSFRSVKIEGQINRLAFIGQELTIDSVALNIVPEPASLLLVLAGCLAASGCRSKTGRRKRTARTGGGRQPGLDNHIESNKSPPRACKPGSVRGAAEAASPTAIPLGRRLPVVSSSLPGSRSEPDRLMLPVWPCTGWGLPSQASHPACWCALTAPFHPYRRSRQFSVFSRQLNALLKTDD